MEIRRALVEDAHLLARLNEHVHAPHLAAEPEVFRARPLDELTDWFAAQLADGGVGLVASDAGAAIGYLLARVVDSTGRLFMQPRRALLVQQLAVAPPARRRGVGRALMAAIEAVARQDALATVQLDVRAINRDALAFYVALGYAPEQLRLSRRLT